MIFGSQLSQLVDGSLVPMYSINEPNFCRFTYCPSRCHFLRQEASGQLCT